MPLQSTPTGTGGTTQADPFVGTPGPSSNLLVDVSTLTVGATGEVGVDGRLNAGVVLTRTGATCTGTAAVAYGVTREPQQLALATIPPTAAVMAAATDQFVGVCTSGLLNRDIMEDNLGRALTAAEIAALETNAGTRFTLTST